MLQIQRTKVNQIIDLLRSMEIPPDCEDSSSDRIQGLDNDALANAYLGIVAICHQTTPLGERPFMGAVGGRELRGWDYLKNKYLSIAACKREWTSFEFFSAVTPLQLSEVFEDAHHGLSLGRINERVLFLNDLGSYLLDAGVDKIADAFETAGRHAYGDTGFFRFLSKTIAYSDPVQKKSLLFLNIMQNLLGWNVQDGRQLKSPIDYHELRGHLRIGTVSLDEQFSRKLTLSLPLTSEEDTALRGIVQGVNGEISGALGISNSRLHYFLWNRFRSCCPTSATLRHCKNCDSACKLPTEYKVGSGCCLASICDSAELTSALVEPVYSGHYY